VNAHTYQPDENIEATEVATIHRIFDACDSQRKGLITAEGLITYIDANRYGFAGPLEVELDTAELIEKLRQATMSVNASIGDRHRGPHDCFCLESLKVMMLAPYTDLENAIGAEGTKLILELREACAQDNVTSKVADLLNINQREVAQMSTSHFTSRRQLVAQHCLALLEPVVAVVIFLNATTIGISLDNAPEWDGWAAFEIFYTLFFVVEVVVRVRLFGLAEHFLGHEWTWNWFDFIVVLLSVIDTSMTLLSRLWTDIALEVNLSSFSVIRLVRLVRITRLVRLLRLKMFQELTLMVSGIIGGLRTLFWAMFFLLGVVYFLGVLLRQLMSSTSSRFDCEKALLTIQKVDKGFFFIHFVGCVYFVLIRGKRFHVTAAGHCHTLFRSELCLQFIFNLFFKGLPVLAILLLLFSAFSQLVILFTDGLFGGLEGRGIGGDHFGGADGGGLGGYIG